MNPSMPSFRCAGAYLSPNLRTASNWGPTLGLMVQGLEKVGGLVGRTARTTAPQPNDISRGHPALAQHAQMPLDGVGVPT